MLVIVLAVVAESVAVPPLVPATDMAEVGLRAWWRDGELLVGMPDRPGRPGLRPLVDLVPVPLPSDLSGWTPVGEECANPPRAEFEDETGPLVAEVAGTAEQPVVRLSRQGRIVAQNVLGRPARTCEVALVEADALPGLELLVAWRMGEDAGEVRGISVFRVPETAR